jgi:hypothetical protein
MPRKIERPTEMAWVGIPMTSTCQIIIHFKLIKDEETLAKGKRGRSRNTVQTLEYSVLDVGC